MLGAGPAGLTAAHVLALRGQRGIVYEAAGMVGGIAKTIRFNGYRFDLGGVRFSTKLKPVQRMWEELLGSDFVLQPRLARVYYQGKYFAYPLKATDVVPRLGLWESTRCALSYLAETCRSRRRHPPETFEEWVTMRFGARLYYAFFRPYTEKVWGIPGSEIRSEWGAQRIQNFSLIKAILQIMHLRRGHVTSRIEKFHYPRLGPGQMWEALRDALVERGMPIRLNHRCTVLRHSGGRITSLGLESDGSTLETRVDGVISSIPLRELVLALDPPAPTDVLDAARRLRYRHMCVVALITEGPQPFPDNWIYLHDTNTLAGRVQNFGAWSEDMVLPGTTCLGVEYYCSEDDEIWTMDHADAVEFAKADLARIGLIDPARVIDGVKVRVPAAYPLYDSRYAESVRTIRRYLEQFENLQTCGRNGLHRHNNQDHSVWTALLAARNLLDGTQDDVWDVDVEAHQPAARQLAPLLVDDIRLVTA